MLSQQPSTNQETCFVESIHCPVDQLIQEEKNQPPTFKPNKNEPRNGISSNDLEVLFIQHRKKLYNFIRSKCTHQNDIDDLVQETYLQAALCAHNFSGRSSFSTWLLGIALNLIRNYYNRSPEFKYSLCDADVLKNFESTELSPDRHIEQSERMEKLQHHIDQLPPLSREMITLLAIEGISYEEIAERFTVTLSAVKSRLFRAREQLRESTCYD